MFNRTLTIGHIATIPIRLHWSWLVIFTLLSLALRPVYARYACGDPSPCGADVGLAALMAALVGVSVLLHELGHALVARRLLVPVHSITLFAFGGVAEVEDEAPSPRAEFAIAVAGPAVSLLIAAAAALIWWARGGMAPAGPVAVLAAHLAAANMIMALFNLLPGYPMDGGRVLRATLWFLNDDLLPATRLASQVGRACGWAIGLGGLSFAMAVGQPLAAIWVGLIGLFLYRTATASYRQHVLQIALHGVCVGDLMQRRMYTPTPDLTLEQFVARFVLGQAETGFAVVEGPDDEAPRLVGMMTLRDLRRFTTAQWPALRVGEAMTPAAQIVSLDPTTTAIDALYALKDSPDGLLPVTDGPHLVGLLRRRDLTVFVQVQMARQRQR
ncbi:MAG: CBS domain-containing protein [Chloroflexales bacterium]|nr:CBS domain-containing protein [Chloroflexales bacterium]